MASLQQKTAAAGNYVQQALGVFAGYGDTEAIVAADGRRYSFAELRANTLTAAANLYHHGMRPGMTIVMLVSNPPESYFIQFGAQLLGCRMVYLARIMATYFLREALSIIKADAFVYEVATCADLGPELARAAAPVPTFCLGAGGIGPDLTDPSGVAELPIDLDTITEAPLTLFQTSGTTGMPKMLAHGDRFFRAIPAVAEFYQPPDRPIRHLNGIGTWHAAGQAAAFLIWMAGGTTVIQFGWDIDEVLDKISKERLTSITIPPAVLNDMLDHPRIGEVDLSSLYRVTVAGSAAAPSRLRQAADRFGDALNVVYGMGELPFITALPDVATVAANHPQRLTSCGRPWGDVRLEIRDPDGSVVPAGKIGEICVSSDLLTEGYAGPPDPAGQRLANGWLRTGDVGRIDDDGYVYIVSRLHDVIVSGLVGENIYPRPIEEVLIGHPFVRDAAVLGVPHPDLGEIVHAYVIRTPEASVTEADLRGLVEQTLNEAWVPNAVEFIDRFPLTEFGKVDKKQLRARYVAEHGEASIGHASIGGNP